MRIRYMVALSVSWKVGVALVGLSLLYVNRMRPEGYFSVTSTASEQLQAVKEAVNRDQENELGLTGLMYAAIYGQLDLAKGLFAYGANLNLQSQHEQQTALHYATNNMRVLASQNVGYYLVDVYANTMVRNSFGQVPLHLVISTDTVDDRTKMVDYLVKNGSDINAQTGQGDTLMHLAVNMKNVDWIETMLKKWATIIDVNIRNTKGLTPYEYAVQLGFETAGELLKKEYKKVERAGEYDSNGLTGLMLAIMKGDQGTIDKMAAESRAVNMTSTDRYRLNALQLAMVYQNVAAVKTLLKQGANVNLKNARGDVAAYALVRVWDVQKKLQMAPLILEKNPAAITMANEDGNTLLHAVVQYNDEALLKYLVEKYKGRVQQGMYQKNNLQESPRDMASRLYRVPISNMLDAAGDIYGRRNNKPAQVQSVTKEKK